MDNLLFPLTVLTPFLVLVLNAFVACVAMRTFDNMTLRSSSLSMLRGTVIIFGLCLILNFSLTTIVSTVANQPLRETLREDMETLLIFCLVAAVVGGTIGLFAAWMNPSKQPHAAESSSVQ